MTINPLGRPAPGLPGVATRRGTTTGTTTGKSSRSTPAADKDRSAGLDEALHGVLLKRPPGHSGDATARARTASLPLRQANAGRPGPSSLPKTVQQLADALCRQVESGALPLRSTPSAEVLQRAARMASARLLDFSRDLLAAGASRAH